MLPPLSARRAPYSRPETFCRSHRSTSSTTFADLSVRRKTAIKKSFKRLDPLGIGAVKLQSALQTLAQAPILTAQGQEELNTCFSRLASKDIDGSAVLTFAAFVSYYVEVSTGIHSESDFEQLLEAHWGFFGVSDILAAFQRQLTLTGLAIAFQDFSQTGHQANNMTAIEFDGCLKRVGLPLRPEDLHRIFGAFFQPGNGMVLADLKEQLMNPRPETPVPLRDTRELATLSEPCSSRPTLTTGLGALVPTSPGAVSLGPLSHRSCVSSGPLSHREVQQAAIQDALGQMEAEVQQLKSRAQKYSPSSGSTSAPGKAGPPTRSADMEAELSRMESNFQHIKAHKAKVDNAPDQLPPLEPCGISTAAPDQTLHVLLNRPEPPPPPPVDMPLRQHRMYGQPEPTWKSERTDFDKSDRTDLYCESDTAEQPPYGSSHAAYLDQYHSKNYPGLSLQAQTHGMSTADSFNAEQDDYQEKLSGSFDDMKHLEQGCPPWKEVQPGRQSEDSEDHGRWVPDSREMGEPGAGPLLQRL